MSNSSFNQVQKRILFLSPTVQGKLEPELKSADFEPIDRLGAGAFGKVYKTKLRKTGQIFALKQMEKQQLIKQGMAKQIQTEVKVMYNLDHPNIIKLHDHFEEENYIFLVIEYAGGGQLHQKLTKEGRFDEISCKRYMADIILAIEYLHSLNPPIIHRDIKPENLILDEAGRVKVVDFGWSNFKNSQRKTYCGTLEYLAPEMIEQKGHDEKLDIWSLGVLIYELITGKTAFVPKVDNSVGQEKIKQLLYDNILKVKFDYPSDFPQLAKDLVNNLCKKEPSQRKSLAEVKKHPWFILEKEGKNIFEMEPWNQKAPQQTQNQYSLKANQIDPFKIENGGIFSSQFIVDFANRLHPNLVKNKLQQMHKSSSGQLGLHQRNSSTDPKGQTSQSQNHSSSALEEENKNLKKRIMQLELKEKENVRLKEELEKYKSLNKRESQEDKVDYLEQLQIKEQELSTLQFKLNQYEKSKGSGVSGGIFDLIRELRNVIEEFKQKFVLTKKQIEINENYGQMERELLKLKLEKDTLKADLKAQIQDEYEDQIEMLKLNHSQEVSTLTNNSDIKISELQKRVEQLLDEQQKKSQKVQENESLQKQLDFANSTIKDLRTEQEMSKEVKKKLEQVNKELQVELEDNKQMVRNFKNNQMKN